MAPAFASSPMFFRSAISELSWPRYARSSGSCQTRSSVRAAARDDLLDERLVVANHCRHLRTERAHRRAGECRDVDDGVGLIAFGREHQRISHHQAAFRVGVLDLDRLAAVNAQDVPHFHGRAGWHVVGAHQIAGDRGAASRAPP